MNVNCSLREAEIGGRFRKWEVDQRSDNRMRQDEKTRQEGMRLIPFEKKIIFYWDS